MCSIDGWAIRIAVSSQVRGVGSKLELLRLRLLECDEVGEMLLWERLRFGKRGLLSELLLLPGGAGDEEIVIACSVCLGAPDPSSHSLCSKRRRAAFVIQPSKTSLRSVLARSWTDEPSSRKVNPLVIPLSFLGTSLASIGQAVQLLLGAHTWSAEPFLACKQCALYKCKLRSRALMRSKLRDTSRSAAVHFRHVDAGPWYLFGLRGSGGSDTSRWIGVCSSFSEGASSDKRCGFWEVAVM